MRIAIPYENGQIFQHFGHTEVFKLYDIEEGKITRSLLLPSGESGHGALAGLLRQGKVNALICGGIGGGAQRALDEAGVILYAGVSGDADEAARAFAEGRLEYATCATCDHHHGGEGHSCGEHGCGSHGCGEHSCG